ncbi:N-acetyltransferase [Flammeovirga pectinis]|uniref:N-acetyltransferase n=1 Tax=Flammeovirga pectinis TaxID=2494373 RepID=A0A3S9P9B2_9BACT|nr:GNAT family N-acetyltransferase [Flammeovirga pectinis]AZQ64767.1 N-acetyltransferase [Flammeovirga pectinis]
MIIFKTERLEIRQVTKKDLDFFIELMSAPEIIDPIPQPKLAPEVIIQRFNNVTDYSIAPLLKEKVIWGVYESGKDELIGLCAFLTNEDENREIGYRFRKKFWGKGYGTELTKNMITYCFTVFELDIVTADVDTKNIGSVKILEKFFHPFKEFYNEDDGCTDRRYILKKEDWLNKQ